MTAGANDLCLLADVLAYLPSGTPTGDQSVLQTLITSASTMIQSYLGYNVASATFNDVRDGNGRHAMIMRNYPVSSVRAVLVDAVNIPESTQWPNSGWSLDEDGRTIYLCGYDFRRGRGNVLITYTAGYETVPADLAQACVELVTFRYFARNKAGQGLVSESGLQQTTAYSQADMPASVKTALAPYRRVFVR